MDVRISNAQARDIWAKQRTRSLNVYTNIPNQTRYHYSWHPDGKIVVGIGRGPGQHRNFNCTISNQFQVTLTPVGGILPLGGIDAAGNPGINLADLYNSVNSRLKQQFRLLCRTRAFNALGRSGQELALVNNEVQNRHNHRQLVIDNQIISPGSKRNCGSIRINGFAIVQNLAGDDTYYRNYDVREAVVARSGEGIRVSEARSATANPILDGTFSGTIRIELLS